jgi:Uma2 family endonuclease
MVSTTLPKTSDSSFYPETDGQPMSDNTRQFQWIVMLADNLAALFHDRPDVFVCGNQNWYPVKGEPEICSAPDVYVVFGRPKGHRSSYKQWEEEGIPMTVVFEVLSPSNTATEMANKLLFYEDYGVEEYYLYDPDTNSLIGYLRRGDILKRNRQMNGFVSPKLGIRFDLTGPELVVRYPNGRPFLTFEEMAIQRVHSDRRAEKAEEDAAQLKQQAARMAELALKAMQQLASPEEVVELQHILQAMPPASNTENKR